MRRARLAHLRGLQVAHELTADALRDERHPGDHHDQPDDAHEPPAAGVMHDRGGHVLLLGSLVAVRARDHLERQVRESGVDQSHGNSDFSRGPAPFPSPVTPKAASLNRHRA